MLDMLTDCAFWIAANHRELNCFREVNSSCDNQETLHILWNPEGYVLCLQEPTTMLNQMNPVHSHPLYFFKLHFDVVLLFMHRSFKWSLSQRKHYQKPICFSLHLCRGHIPCPYHHFLFAHLHINSCWGLYIMKLHITQYSAYFWCFLILRLRYLP